MFNKNTNIAYSLHPSPPLAGYATSADDILFHHHHHHHHDLLSGHYYGAPIANAVNAPVMVEGAFYHHGDGGGMPSSCPRGGVKKDRHSKIYTSQGPRDRRVRLSIGVARRFFDLQEILGFDKPSKTLDWLLTKSKTAIKDLEVGVNQTPGSCNTSPSESDSGEAGNLDSKRKLVEIMSEKNKGDSAKESRVKARARARERTREKMNIKQLNHHDHTSSSSSLPMHHMNNQLEFCKISHTHPPPNMFFEPTPNDQDLIQEESIHVIKRKVKHPSANSIMGFHQNLIISSSNYGLPSPYINPTDTSNWDISTSFASQILDPQRFINSSSSNN